MRWDVSAQLMRQENEANPSFLCLLFYLGPHQIVFSLFSGSTSVGLGSLTGEVTQFFMSWVFG